MNATEHRPEGPEREELARLLPVPAERDLPTGRHTLYREHLMSKIQQDVATSSATSSATAPLAPARRPRRLRRSLIALPLIAAAVAGGVALHRDTIPSAGGGTDVWYPATVVGVQAGSTQGVTATLDRIAAAAQARPSLAAGPDQFVYVRSEARGSKVPMDGSGWETGSLIVRETWYSQQPATHVSLYRQNGVTSHLNAEADPVGLFNPTYAWCATLPTDPAALLKAVYADLAGSGVAASLGDQQAAFEQMGELLESTTMPSRTQAALYRAVALIPGVTLIPDSVDAAGRHGLGIARTENTGMRVEWVFDRNTLAYLGQRQYLVRDTSGSQGPDAAPKGTLVGTDAVLAWGVTDSAGLAPSGGAVVG